VAMIAYRALPGQCGTKVETPAYEPGTRE
jgi:hypothetical protein